MQLFTIKPNLQVGAKGTHPIEHNKQIIFGLYNKMIFRVSINIVLFMTMLFLSSSSWSSALSITPVSFAVLPTSISEGQSAMAYYIVKNNTTDFQKNINVRYLPPNVEQVVSKPVLKNTCGLFFELSPKGTIPQSDKEPYDWCFLQLKISGAVDSSETSPEHHLTICNGDSNCSFVDSKEHELNVIQGISNSLARFSVVMEHFEEPTKSTKSIAYSSTDGGIGWEPHEIPGAMGYVRAMSCNGNDGKFCIIVGDAYGKSTNGGTTTFLAYTSNDGGTIWTKRILGVHGAVSGLSDVTCSGDNGEYCITAGGFTPISSKRQNMAPIVYTTSDNGANWIPNYPKTFDSLVGARIDAVSCDGNSGQNCTAVGLFYSGYENNTNTVTFLSYSSTDGGHNWTPHILEKYADSGVSRLNSIKCNRDDGQACIAVGAINDGTINKAIIYRSKNGGAEWSYSIPSEKVRGELNAVTCDKYNQNCKAGGSVAGHPIVYQTKDGGETWTSKQLSGCRGTICPQTIKAISCSDNGKYCTAIGSAHDKKDLIPIVYVSIDDGINWYPRDNSAFSNYGDLIRSIESVGILESSFE